jgi:hypothetical protein
MALTSRWIDRAKECGFTELDLVPVVADPGEEGVVGTHPRPVETYGRRTFGPSTALRSCHAPAQANRHARGEQGHVCAAFLRNPGEDEWAPPGGQFS